LTKKKRTTSSTGTIKFIKMKNKNKKNTTVGTIPKFNRKIVERGKIDTSRTQIHDHSLSWLGTGTSIKSDGVKYLK